MKKEELIVHYTAEELDAMIARGESQTDWNRVRQMTDQEIESSADKDPDSPPYLYPPDFGQDAKKLLPEEKIPAGLKAQFTSQETVT
jgi:hypothetical protein